MIKFMHAAPGTYVKQEVNADGTMGCAMIYCIKSRHATHLPGLAMLFQPTFVRYSLCQHCTRIEP